MIENLELRNFKCFVRQEFALRKLTVLCGPNAAGKSSVIQAILLAKSAAALDSPEGFLPLNGPHTLELGAVGDILCHTPTSSAIEILLKTDAPSDTTLAADASAGKLEDRFLSVRRTGHDFPPSFASRRGFDFIYLAPERLGPRDSHTTQSHPQSSLTIGPRGEYTAEILAQFERKEVRPSVAHPTRESNAPALLRQQAELWMGEWAPKIQIRAEAFPNTNISTLRFQRRDIQSEWMRPTNVGFGVSHSLPIVLAGLLMEPEGILVVDSPESHLHPSGQSAMGRFLATVASSGIQVIVETHSDHIINGMRIAVATQTNGLSHEDVVIYNIAVNQTPSSVVERLHFTPTANLDHWPAGFCDQIEKDLAELSALRKQNG